MNAKVHPLVALLVIALTIAAIGVWAWGSGESKRFGGPAALLEDPSGHLYVQMQNFLLEHDVDGQFVARHDLSSLGVDHVLGGMAFFPNGDLLLRGGRDTRSVIDNIRAYLRLPNTSSTQADDPESGLLRCDLDRAACVRFGRQAIDFRAVFSVFIDPSTEEVYISDTSRHALHKYSADGELLATSEVGFRYPNHLRLIDDRLYVANTNHHRIQIVDPATESFADAIVAKNVVPAVARRSKQIWPSHFLRVDEQWWVNNMRSDMAEGGIYIFDRNWLFERKVDLPEGADPIALLTFGDEVLISDWNHDRVHRVSLDGRLLGDLQSPGLQALIDESISLRWQYQTYAYLGAIALALIIIALLVKGLLAAPAESPSARAPQAAPVAASTGEPVWITPDEALARKIRLSTWLGGIFLVVPVPVLAYVIVASGAGVALLKFIPPMAAICIIFLALLRVNHSLINTGIGLQGEQITLRDHTGKETTFRIRDVIYNDTAIAGEGTAVFLGQKQMAVYDQEALRSQVFPRLGDARAVSAWEMQKALLRMRHPQVRTLMLVFAGVFIGGIWLLLNRGSL